jgi:DNA polymerase III subunit beta
MKIEILKSDLLNMISKTQNIVEKRTTMPVLINVLLEAKGSTLKIFATNLEISLTTEATVRIAQEGRAAVSAKSLFEIIKELPEGKIEITRSENNWVKIAQGKSVFNLVGIGPEEYPVFPSHTSNDFVEISTELFLDMIAKTIYSVSTDETRYHLNGVYFEKPIGRGTTGYLMVATDGHRLSLVNRSGADRAADTPGPEGVIIPKKGLAEIYKLLEGAPENFKMAVEGSQLVVVIGSTVLMVRLIEGKYPNYRQLIPQGLNQTVKLNREVLLSSLKRVSLLSNQKSKGVTLTFNDGKLEITSNNPELGDAKEEIPVDYSGKSMRIGFNAKYIMEALTAIQEEEIDLDLKDQLSPGVLRPKADKNYTCVIMPMRI